MNTTHPVIAPAGHVFVLATQNKFFSSAPRGGKSQRPKIITTNNRQNAMKFTCRKLAESFLSFVNNGHLFPDGDQYHIVLTSAGYAGYTKMELSSIA